MKRICALLLALLFLTLCGLSARATRGWRDENQAFDLKAASWGPMGQDYAITRYYYGDFVSRLKEGDPRPNVWLRLDSRETLDALKGLPDFKVVAGRASCAHMPVPLNTLDDPTGDWGKQYFRPMAGFNRAALDIWLEEGENLHNVTIACTRTRPDGSKETITLPLSAVPQDMLYPEGGLKVTALRVQPFAFSRSRVAAFQSFSPLPATLGNLLTWEVLQPIPSAPESLLNLPGDTDEVALYLISGRMEKQAGFGVHDVLFSLENVPEGIYLAEYQYCGSCSEIDVFDMGEGSYSRGFAVLLMVEPRGRSQEEVFRLINTLDIRLSFSAELWNIVFEQHLTTTGIGPRSQVKAEMSGITQLDEVLEEIPEAYYQ